MKRIPSRARCRGPYLSHDVIIAMMTLFGFLSRDQERQRGRNRREPSQAFP